MPISLHIEGIENISKIGGDFLKAREKMSGLFFKASKKFALDAVGIIKEKYLSGPRPSILQPVTGRLRSSITQNVAEGNNRGDIEIKVGTNVEYAPFHEFGFDGTVRVPAHTRVIKKAFGRKIDPVSAFVRSFSKRLKVKPRPFIKPGVADALPNFENSLSKILMEIPFSEELK